MAVQQSIKTIHPASPRERVQVVFNGNGNGDPKVIYEGPMGTPLLEFFAAWADEQNLPTEDRAIAAVVENRLRELTVPVTRDVTVQPITLRHSDGSRIYRRTLSFLLVVAIAECFPGAQVAIDHSLPSGAFFCHMVNHQKLTPAELATIKAKMHEIAQADDPITRQNIPLSEAKAIFEARNDADKLRLLTIREEDYLSVYELRGYVDYFFGYMAPSTGSLKWFDLMPYGDGFALMYPTREKLGEMPSYVDSPKMAEVFHQTGEWLELMGVEDVGQLNEALQKGRTRELVLVNEALHERHIAAIAATVAERHHRGVRVVLIAGPSSSGKTTFSKRLAIQLMTHGLKPFTLEMDNYFVDRDLTPLDESGELDFEDLHALNVERLNRDLLNLISGRPTVLPVFSFYTGTGQDGPTVQLSQEHIIILEGIHGMNPNLTPEVPAENTYRIYVSALTQLNIDRHNRVPTTDIRLLRRIVRDAATRNYTAEDTLARWQSVRRGEKRNIFPYQENADVMFNSALVYELSVLRPLAEPLLLRVNPDSILRVEAHRLLSFLRWVREMDAEFVPDNSLMREFIGGSILKDYHPGN